MEQLLDVKGISLDNNIHILQGESIPGLSEDTDAAPPGSVYYTTMGDTWKKNSTGAGATKWSKETGTALDSGILSVNGVPANQVKILDLLDRTKIETAVWSLTIRETAHPTNKEVVTLTGSHNDAMAKYAVYSRLVFGQKIPVLNYSVQLVGDNLQLVASAGVGIDIECYRLSAVAKGTIQIIGGTGGGTGDVTSAQLAAETASRQAADTALQNAIDTKAEITGVATQFAAVQAQIAALPTGGSGGVSQALLDAETAARAAADLALAQNIASEATERSTADNSLTQAVATEAASRATADAALQSAIDALGGGGVTHFEVTLTNTDLVGGIFTLTHSLARKYVSVQLYDNTDLQIIPDEVHPIDATKAEINMTSFAPLTGTWTAVAKK